MSLKKNLIFHRGPWGGRIREGADWVIKSRAGLILVDAELWDYYGLLSFITWSVGWRRPLLSGHIDTHTHTHTQTHTNAHTLTLLHE